MYWSVFKTRKTTYTHKGIINIYIVYETKLWDLGYTDDSTLGDAILDLFSLLKMPISKNIRGMVLNLIQKELFHFVLKDLAKM